jgi:subtilisin family serine protease
MSVDLRMRSQVNLILDNLPDSAAHPDPAQWDDPGVDDVDYLYRKHTILTRELDVNRVVTAIERILGREGYGDLPEGEARQIRPERITGTRRVFRLTLPRTGKPVPAILDALDQDPELGSGVAQPDHVLYVTGYPCAAIEPTPVPRGTQPVPPSGLNARGCRRCHGVPRPGCDGDGVDISIVDTGLIKDAAAGHPWLAGVNGETDPVTKADGTIAYDAGHGTFVAGVARCMAPKASIYVERAFGFPGANFETNLVGTSLQNALNRDPDILEFTFCATTRNDLSLMTFDDLFETRIRYIKGLVVLAPAGNDGSSRRTWPAAYREVISVGALSGSWPDRAWFSNYGKWVDVYAPGQDLVNAFPWGTYKCEEPPVGQVREFEGMAKWSGTSFSTPVVAGLIAARMSATGENARQAADALLRLACTQAVPGIGAVLYPGQACCEADCCRH